VTPDPKEDPMPTLFPTTRISFDDPIPTTASSSLVAGTKLRLEFELDIAATVGRLLLAGEPPGVIGDLVRESITKAAKDLFAAMVAAQAITKGSA